ncbi:MAG: DUF4912 domain-containing protein [bacterium]
MAKANGKNGDWHSVANKGKNGKSCPSPRLRKDPLPIDTSAHKFELKPNIQPLPLEPPAYEYLGELPHAYGSKRLFLTARDPHWLFAYWDLTWDQFTQAEAAAHDHKVFLQIYHESGDRVQQIHLHAGSREWCVNVNEAGGSFFAEIGYYRHDGHFEVLCRSSVATTPRDGMSWKTHSAFVTIPFHFTFKELMDLVDGHALPGEELAETLARLEADGFPFPFETFVLKALGEDSHDALLDYLRGDFVRRIQLGSMEITELLRKQLSEMRSSGQWSGSVSSPFGASFGAQEREFFMNVNAELIIYGGTSPDAKVRVDGQEISLRPDGTFSYHFTFKDGGYHIPITAQSADGEETRSAMLSFMRVTDQSEGVEATPQPTLPEPFGRV